MTVGTLDSVSNPIKVFEELAKLVLKGAFIEHLIKTW